MIPKHYSRSERVDVFHVIREFHFINLRSNKYGAKPKSEKKNHFKQKKQKVLYVEINNYEVTNFGDFGLNLVNHVQINLIKVFSVQMRLNLLQIIHPFPGFNMSKSGSKRVNFLKIVVNYFHLCVN